jgi:hypothetical protein
MSNVPFKVFVLRKEFDYASLPAKKDASAESIGGDVLDMLSSFTSWLEETIRDVGFVFRGPNQTIDTGWASEYLVCLHSPWPKLTSIPDCKHRTPDGEIFESTDDIYYASTDKLIALENEVLIDFYSNEHGRHIGTLETDLRRRLKKACMAECHSLGFTRGASSDIAKGMVEELNCLPLNSWTWNGVQEAILSQVEAYASTRRRPYVWMVREQLVVESSDVIAEPIADGDLVRQAIPAIHPKDDVREWLVEAQPLLRSLRLPVPEFESVRRLQPGELFFSERGLIYRSEDGPVWLGEIATDLLHDRHGECLLDAESLVREDVVRLLMGKIEGDHPLTPDQYARAVDAAHEQATEADVLQMWYQDLDGMVEILKKNQ